jgi:hypothetical protein
MSMHSATSPGTNPLGTKWILRVVLATAGVIAAVVLASIWSLLWLFLTGSDSDSSAALIVTAVLTLFLAPVILFVVISSWPIESGAQKHSALRAASWALGGLELAAGTIVTVTGYRTQPLVWIPLSALIMCIGFTTLAVVLGRALRIEVSGMPAAVPGESTLEPWMKSARARVPMVAVVVPVTILVMTAVALLVFQPWDSEGPGAALRSQAALGILFGLSLGFIATSLVVAFRSVPLAFRLSRALPRSAPARKRILRAVSRETAAQLSLVELETGRRYAADVSAALPWSLLQFGYLFAGILCQQIGEALQPHPLLGPWGALGVGVVYVVALGSMADLLRRSRRFRRINGEPAAIAAIDPEPNSGLIRT